MDGLAYFSAKGLGQIAAWCVGIDIGIGIEGEESESRNHRTFMPRDVTNSSFTVMVKFGNYQSWKDFNQWMEKYSRGIGYSLFPPMSVFIPERRFGRNGVPTKGFMYGEQMDKFTWTSTLEFEGTVDPIRPGDKGSTQYPNIPVAANRSFYPTGDQASAQDRAENLLYDERATLSGPDHLTKQLIKGDIYIKRPGPDHLTDLLTAVKPTVRPLKGER